MKPPCLHRLPLVFVLVAFAGALFVLIACLAPRAPRLVWRCDDGEPSPVPRCSEEHDLIRIVRHHEGGLTSRTHCVCMRGMVPADVDTGCYTAANGARHVAIDGRDEGPLYDDETCAAGVARVRDDLR